MENQHRQIKGYRELSQAEIDLMNEIKTKGAELSELMVKVRASISAQATAAHGNAEELKRLEAASPGRWASIGATHFQEGLMCLTRSVAQPTFF